MQHLLNKTATIQRKTQTQNNIGELIESFATIGTHATRYAKASGASVGIVNDYQKTVGEYLFFFNQGIDILLEDQILIDSKVFQIKSIDTFDGMANAHHIEVTAILTQFG